MKQVKINMEQKIVYNLDDCEVCGKTIRVMCFRLTGVCSGDCEKARDEKPIKVSKNRKGAKK